MQDRLKEFLKQYPFMTQLSYGGKTYIGIVQNKNNTWTHLYDFGSLVTPEERKRFLQLGEEWWWQSNRKIAINVFFRNDWKEFTKTSRVFNSRDVEIIEGPAISLKDISTKRTKRKSITLVKKPR